MQIGSHTFLAVLSRSHDNFLYVQFQLFFDQLMQCSSLILVIFKSEFLIIHNIINQIVDFQSMSLLRINRSRHSVKSKPQNPNDEELAAFLQKEMKDQDAPIKPYVCL